MRSYCPFVMHLHGSLASSIYMSLFLSSSYSTASAVVGSYLGQFLQDMIRTYAVIDQLLLFLNLRIIPFEE